MIREQARGLDFHSHVGELELDGLEFADSLSELFALLGIFQRGFVRALRHSQAERGDGDAPAIEYLQAVDEAFALRAQQIFRGHPAIAENYFGRVAGAQAQLVFFFARTKAGSSLLQDERGDSVAAFGLVGEGHADADVRVVAVGGERFGAVEHPVVGVFDRGAARAACIGAGFRFGERPAAQFLPLRERDEILLLLRLAAEFVDVIGAKRIMGGDDDGHRTVDAGQFFDGDGVLDVTEAGAAVFLWKNYAEQAEIGQRGNNFLRKVGSFIPLHDVRKDLGFSEFADRAAKLLLFVG